MFKMKNIISLLIVIFISTGLIGSVYAGPYQEDLDKNTPQEVKNCLNYISKQGGINVEESKLINDMLDDQIQGSDSNILHGYMGCPDAKCNVSGYNPNKTYKEEIESDPHMREMKDNVHYDIKAFSKKKS